MAENWVARSAEPKAVELAALRVAPMDQKKVVT
jgi:hypothetical protein